MKMSQLTQLYAACWDIFTVYSIYLQRSRA